MKLRGKKQSLRLAAPHLSEGDAGGGVDAGREHHALTKHQEGGVGQVTHERHLNTHLNHLRHVHDVRVHVCREDKRGSSLLECYLTKGREDGAS